MRTFDFPDGSEFPATDTDGPRDAPGLPPILGHALAALNSFVAPGVAADVAAEIPSLAASAAEWAEHPACPLWRTLADGVDERACEEGRPDLHALADTVRLVSMSASEARLMSDKASRVAASLHDAKRVAGCAGVEAPILADVERLAIGWMALAAGSVEVSLGHLQSANRKAYDLGFEFTEAVDVAAEARNGGQGPVSPDQGVSAPPAGDAVVVCPPVQEATQAMTEVVRAHAHAVGTALPLVGTPDIAGVRRVLVAEYPYTVAAIDGLLSPLVSQRFVRLPPTILVGPAGSGKSRLARRLAELLGVGLWRTDAARPDGGGFAGTDRRWSTAECCHAFLAVSRHRIANPMVLVDELDKAGTGRRNGRIQDALLGFLERETSSSYPDPQLQVNLDLSHVSYVMTCNDVAGLPAPLLDRCRVVAVPCPSPGHMDALLVPILGGIAREEGLDERWLGPLTPDERALVGRHWRGGSVRHLAKLVAAVVRGRDRLAPTARH